jgi:hypothetical protein
LVPDLPQSATCVVIGIAEFAPALALHHNVQVVAHRVAETLKRMVKLTAVTIQALGQYNRRSFDILAGEESIDERTPLGLAHAQQHDGSLNPSEESGRRCIACSPGAS